jgi:integral membrane sensor domain MASE1
MSQASLSRRAGILFAVGAAYYGAGKLGLSLAFVNASATAVWPPAGIALAALLLFGNRVWPAILAGAFLVNLATTGTIATSLAIAVGNTLEGRRRLHSCGVSPRAPCFRPPAGHLQIAGLVSISAIRALIGDPSWPSWPGDGAVLGRTWLTWWLGDTAGVLVVGSR